MKKKLKLIVFAFILATIIINSIAIPKSQAGVTWGDIEGAASSFIGMGGSNPIDMGAVNTTVNSIGQILTTIGVAVVLVGILYMGIKYMMASPEEAAKIKGQLVGLVVSAIVIFGAWAIWTTAVTFFQEMGL